MKLVLSLVLIIVIGCFCAGCGGNDAESNESNTAMSPAGGAPNMQNSLPPRPPSREMASAQATADAMRKTTP